MTIVTGSNYGRVECKVCCCIRAITKRQHCCARVDARQQMSTAQNSVARHSCASRGQCYRFEGLDTSRSMKACAEMGERETACRFLHLSFEVSSHGRQANVRCSDLHQSSAVQAWHGMSLRSVLCRGAAHFTSYRVSVALANPSICYKHALLPFATIAVQRVRCMQPNLNLPASAYHMCTE